MVPSPVAVMFNINCPSGCPYPGASIALCSVCPYHAEAVFS